MSSPRTDSMIGVKGWYCANCLKPCPILAAGTMALLRKGSRMSGTVAMAKGRDLRISSKQQRRTQPDLEAADEQRRSVGVLVGD